MFGTLKAIEVVNPPKDLVQRFKNVDDRLDLRFVQFPFSDGANMNSVRHWAIVLKWSENDKRRQLIQRGDLPEDFDFDMLGMLPLNCNAQDAFSFFEKTAVGLLKDGNDVQYLVSRLKRFNDGIQRDVLNEQLDRAQELIEDNVGTLFREEGKGIPKIAFSNLALPTDMLNK